LHDRGCRKHLFLEGHSNTVVCTTSGGATVERLFRSAVNFAALTGFIIVLPFLYLVPGLSEDERWLLDTVGLMLLPFSAALWWITIRRLVFQRPGGFIAPWVVFALTSVGFTSGEPHEPIPQTGQAFQRLPSGDGRPAEEANHDSGYPVRDVRAPFSMCEKSGRQVSATRVHDSTL
jgi:hypothetical protein